MELTRITYTGHKVYRDKLSSNIWNPGDTKLVTDAQAAKLLRFAEFSTATKTSKATDTEMEEAMVRQQEVDRADKQEHEQQESMLMMVESMDKGALEEYARKYEVELDKRLGVVKLRAEVSNLIEQFGAR